MINIIHFDTEGGWGGSSVSLFKIVKNLDKNYFKSFVICRKKGPILKQYKKINTFAELNTDLYSFSPKPKINNLKLFVTTIPQFLFFFRGIFKALSIIKNKKIDLIHLNFEGFFLLGIILRLITNLPIILHYRSTIPLNSISHKFISYLIVNYVANHIIFISKTEKKKFFKIYPKFNKIKSTVIYNFSDCRYIKYTNRKDLTYIGNISYAKGVDKLFDLAQYFHQQKLKIKIKIYGETRGEEKYFKKIKKRIVDSNLKNIVLKGRTESAEAVIQKSKIILRPSRLNDPWGRDVLDAFSAEVPCISTGTYNDIIINKVNSFYVNNFEIKKVYKIICKLIFDQKYYDKIRYGIRNTTKTLLNKETNIKKLEEIYRSII